MSLPSTYESFLRGQVAYHEEDFAVAHRHFRAALRTDPESAYLHGWVARALLAQGRTSQAREAVDEALEIDGCSEFALCTAASILVETGDHAAALRTLRRAIECEPRQPEAYYQLAELLEDQDSRRRAADVYQSLLEVRPRQARAHAELARLMVSEGASDDEMRHLSMLLELEPWRSETFRDLASGAFAMGETARARALAETVIMRNPRDDETRRVLIDILLTSGDTASAARHLSLLRPDEDNASELAELSRLLLAARRFEAAEREASRALEIDGSQPLAGVVLVGALRGLGRVDAALEAYRRLSPSRTETDGAAREAALALWEGGRREAARELLERRLEASSRSPRARELLARLHESEDRAEAAEAVLRAGPLPEDRVSLGALMLRGGRAREAATLLEGVDEENESTRQLVLLGRALLELHEERGSEDHLDAGDALVQRALREERNDASLWTLQGALASARGRHEAALRELRRADRFRPGSIWTMTQLALALLRSGECADAADVAGRALRLRPGSRDRARLEGLVRSAEEACDRPEAE